MKEIIAGIYSITSKHNGKVYIGSSVNIYKRWDQHKKQLKQNKHGNLYLQNHFNKYGEQDLVYSIVEIVTEITNLKEILLIAEQSYLDKTVNRFNIRNLVNSSLGIRKKGAKNYSKIHDNLYIVRIYIYDREIRETFNMEQEAKDFVEYIFNYGLMRYYNEKYIITSKANPIFREPNNKWSVRFWLLINDKPKRVYVGIFNTLEEAENIVHLALNKMPTNKWIEEYKKTIDLSITNSAVGYKWIYKAKDTYRVGLLNKKCTFKTLKEAVEARNQFLINKGYKLLNYQYIE